MSPSGKNKTKKKQKTTNLQDVEQIWILKTILHYQDI